MVDDSEVDVQAVQRDAALVDVLAARGDLEPFVGDPVVALLGPWVAHVDAGVDSGMPVAEGPAPPSSSRARGRAGLVAGVTTAVLVVSAGAAAAVTGDPLVVVRAPLQALERVIPAGDEHEEATTTLPEPAAPAAEPNKLLAHAQRALAQGDEEEAARLLADAQTLLGDSADPGQRQRIDRLQNRLDHPKPHGKGSSEGQGQGSSQGQGQGPGADRGEGSDGREQQPRGGAGGRSEQPASTPSSAGGTGKPDTGASDEGQGGPPGQGSSAG